MPKDQWDFVSKDDEVEEPRDEPAPEVSALHVTKGPARTPASDPGESEVLVGMDDDSEVAQFFDDEEPEGEVAAVEAEAPEEDLEQLLEEQHYAFAPETVEE